MEAIVSLLILGILMTTLITIVRFSMTMTGNAINEAEDAQNAFNNLILENYTGAGGTLTFTPVQVSASNPNLLRPPPQPPLTPPPLPTPLTSGFTTATEHYINISNDVPDVIAFAPAGGTP